MKRWPLMVLLAIAALIGGCRSKHERSYRGQVQVLEGDQTALVELAAGSLAAVSLADGVVQWRYQPVMTPSPYLDYAERYRLVCPVVRTPGGDLLLRYDDELHVLSRKDGRLRWKRRVYRWAADRLRCPAATADSGVVLLRHSGLRVQKLAADGSPSWVVGLTLVGAAISPPKVSPESGDVLIQTASHLVNISPAGAINWARLRDKLIDAGHSAGSP